ncbi:MAG: glycosyl hydrolase 115 family protein [Chthoniobacterales bacterium]
MFLTLGRFLLLAVLPAIASAGELALKDAIGGLTDFPVAVDGRAAEIVTDKAEADVVHIAADLLASDVERVSGVKPRVAVAIAGQTTPVIVIGTLGKSALITDLVKRGKLDDKGLEGQWESFVITTVVAPYPGINTALVIVGSDHRGTAFGALSLSEAIGVSPWEWWADVPPLPRKTLVVSAETHTQGPPSVKYRGIFINDEDWGIRPWAAKTFEPEAQNLGPKTYAKICELLLRLKANSLWPAMHPGTKAFNSFPENKLVANRYGIVMGSSHCEPLLRNNVGEWDGKTRGEWNYQTNRAGVLNYWEERVEENGLFENNFTLGMRGVHDGEMPFKGSMPERVALMQQIIRDQRGLLTKYVNPKIEQVPQIFIPYKEVLTTYQNGLQVPEDVTLVWPDDNHGYIRRLSTPEEQKRSGGSGVYYHLSYWGAPEDYLWLCTTPPALIWEEMRKAYDHGARRLWIANVGDLKPAEIDLEFFLRMAWDVSQWDEKAQPTFLAQWAQRTFGKTSSTDIAAVLDEYYRLNYPAKPEHLLKAQFTTNYNEIGQRLQRFTALVEKTNAIYEKLPPALRDAFYELVAYPVRCSALMNEKYLSSDPAKSQAAHDQIQAETKIYNEQIANGKWNRMMSASPRGGAVFKKVSSSPALAALSPAKPADDGYISLEAEKPSRTTNGSGATWKTIAGLGRSGDSIALLPTGESVPAAAALEYEFNSSHTGSARVLVYSIPTHALHSGLKLRYSIGIDNEPPQEVDLESAEFSPQWSANVLRGTAIGTTNHSLTAGRHTLKIQPLDPGLVFDKVVLDLGRLQPTHLGPPASAAP